MKVKEKPLTIEEINYIKNSTVCRDACDNSFKVGEQQGIEKGRREVVKWGNEVCREHWVNSTPKRWKCVECWQELQKLGE